MANPGAIRFLRLERTSDAVRKQLTEIDQVRGVQGWMVATGTGKVLLTSLRSTLDLETLDTIGDHLIRSGTGVSGDEPTSELEISYTQGSVFAHKIGTGWLIVFCDVQADLAMARLTLGVTAAALCRDRPMLSDINKSSQPPPSTLNGSFSSAPRGLKYN